MCEQGITFCCWKFSSSTSWYVVFIFMQNLKYRDKIWKISKLALGWYKSQRVLLSSPFHDEKVPQLMLLWYTRYHKSHITSLSVSPLSSGCSPCSFSSSPWSLPSTALKAGWASTGPATWSVFIWRMLTWWCWWRQCWQWLEWFSDGPWQINVLPCSRILLGAG